MSRPASIALIDISYLFKKHWHLNDGSRMAAANGALRDLERLKEGVGHVIVCRDAPPYKRKEIFDAYKANRPQREAEELHQARHLYKEIQRLGYSVAHSQGYEADDVIATLCRHYETWCEDVRIVGPDKDCAQLITERVRQFIPPMGDKEWEVRDVAAVLSKWGVGPRQMPLYQALVGDSSDNIPGVDKIGAETAKKLVQKYPALQLLQAGTIAGLPSDFKPAVRASLQKNWPDLVLSLKLVTLDANVPLDAEALLVQREPVAEVEKENDMEIERNETPMPPAIQQDGADLRTHPGFEDAKRAYFEHINQRVPVEASAVETEYVDEQSERERRENGEHVEESAVVEKPKPPVSARPAPLVQVPSYTQTKYGLVTADLQPVDLQAAYHMSEWLFKGGLYAQFKSPSQIFTIMMRAKELGLGVTTALAGFHIIDGKPCPSADLIRALVERDANFEYLMPIEMSPSKVVWEGKHKRQPKPVQYTYTIEDARAAGLVRQGNYGKPGNWEKRPQDMLMKTAASKLARLLWPGATMGLYCVEEMGYSTEELEAA